MYYENKQSFYIKQYGPKVFIMVFSVFIIGLGVYIYLSNTNQNTSTSKDVVVATENQKEENSSINTSSLPDSLETLRPLQKTAVAKLESVTSNGTVIVNIENSNIEVSLIGVDFRSSSSDISVKMTEDLKDKEIKLAFDKEKTDKNEIDAYIYIDDTLYNAQIIEKGYGTFKKENKNTKLQDDLTQAQAYAKQNQLGIWSTE